NLVFYQGEVLSQTLTGIASYPQLQTKLTLIDERIKKNPNDPVGLVERGELRLDRGDRAGALQDLHTALKNNPPADLIPKAREKLYETLTEMFQVDFSATEATYPGLIDEYKALCKSDNAEEQRKRQANFLCLLAKGRERQGRLEEAYQAYMDFGALNASQELISVIDEPATKSPPAVRARGRIAAMMEKASAAQRQPLEVKLAGDWNAVKDTGDIVALRRFVDLFGPTIAVGRQARLYLAERLIEGSKDPKADELRQAQLLLLQLHGQKSVDPQSAGQ